MTAAGAASGLRAWMHTRHFGWLTPRRMRLLTVAVMCAAGLLSTVGFSGSSASVPGHHGAQARPVSRARV